MAEDQAQEFVRDVAGQDEEEYALGQYLAQMESQMETAARNLQFEKAAKLRDRIGELKSLTAPEKAVKGSAVRRGKKKR